MHFSMLENSLTSKIFSHIFFSFCQSLFFFVSSVGLCVLVGGQGYENKSLPSLPGNVFIFPDPSSSLLRGGVSPLLSPGPRGAL